MALSALSDEEFIILVSFLPFIERLLLVRASCRCWNSLRQNESLWHHISILIDRETHMFGDRYTLHDLNEMVSAPALNMRGVWHALAALVPPHAVQRISIH